jgi:cobalt-zinc-cadmium efflux system membrane fusion protein
VAALLTLALFGAYLAGVPLPGVSAAADEKTVSAPPPLGVELVKDAAHTLSVPEDVRAALGMRKGKEESVAEAKTPTGTRPLVLPGSTTLDPTRLMRVRVRFAPAEVVEIGQCSDRGKDGYTESRELRSGDRVQKGQLLAVVYSVDVGSKKNDLIDALVQLKLDQEVLDRAEKAAVTGAIPEVFLLSARRDVEADRNAIARALNTLKTWGIPEEDIRAAQEEAERISQRKGQRDKGKEGQWARVELRAPDEGTIVERNFAVRDMVVDNTVNLFQVARVDRMVVVANAPEDDLPTLLDPAFKRQWKVQTVGAKSDGGIVGPIDEVSYLIDVNQHNAVVKGHIENPDNRLRAGQFVSATIELPPPKDVVEIPVAAVVDDGKQCVVFVQPDPAKPQYTLRRVVVTHRFEKSVFVRSELTEAERQLAPEEKEAGLLPKDPLLNGERVLTAGVLELKKELEDRESNSPVEN